MSALNDLTELTARQGALLTITYDACADCDTLHSRVEIQLPDGYSWNSPLSGPFSGIGVNSECGQNWSDLYAEMYQVIDHTVIRD
jgi:hypothetical protein